MKFSGSLLADREEAINTMKLGIFTHKMATFQLYFGRSFMIIISSTTRNELSTTE
jgi:hypothetical protein